MNTEKIQILILTYKREHGYRTIYCWLQVFDTRHKRLRNVTPGLCTKPGVRAGTDGQLCHTELCKAGLGSGSGSSLWDNCCIPALSAVFKLPPSSICPFVCDSLEKVQRLWPAQIICASSPAQIVLCCCPEHRSDLFHELELPKLADFVHLKLDASWCVKWCLK